VIKIVNLKAKFTNLALNKTLKRLWGSLKIFISFDIYHILCSSKKEADKKANKGCSLKQGVSRKMMRHLSQSHSIKVRLNIRKKHEMNRLFNEKRD
jgi:hypothetical protein